MGDRVKCGKSSGDWVTIDAWHFTVPKPDGLRWEEQSALRSYEYTLLYWRIIASKVGHDFWSSNVVAIEAD